MKHLIGTIPYPAENGFAVESASLYAEDTQNRLVFKLINRSEKTVNAYRALVSYQENGEEKSISIEKRNLEITQGSTSEEHSIALPAGIEEGTITLAVAIYDDLSHNEEQIKFSFASYDVISRVANDVLSQGVPMAANQQAARPATASSKTSIPTTAKTNSPKVQTTTQTTKKSLLPLILALSSLFGVVLTFVISILVYPSIIEKEELGIISSAKFVVIELIFLVVFSIYPIIALIAMTLRKKSASYGVAVLITSILTLVCSFYILVSSYTFLFVCLIYFLLGIIFLVIAIVKKDLPLLLTTIAMVLIAVTNFCMWGSNIVGCSSAEAPTEAPKEEGITDSSETNNPYDTNEFLVLIYENNGNGTKNIADFQYTSDVTSVNEDYIPIYNGKAELIIPTHCSEGSTIVGINESAFMFCGEIESVVLTESIITIGKKAFSECRNLKKVDLGGTKFIGEEAFLECSSLEVVERTENIQIIEASAFQSCTSLTSFDFGGKLNRVDELAFAFSGLKNVYLPGSLVGVGESIFFECSALEEVSFSEGCTTVSREMFAYCQNLTTVRLTGVTDIGEFAFLNCSSLTTVSEPESLKKIDNGAFSHCTSLTNISLPEGLTTIGNSAFWSSGLETVTIPSTVTDFGESAFLSCGNLQVATITTNDVTYIPNSTFSYCTSLWCVYLPREITFIDHNAFFECYALAHVYFEGSEEEWNQISYGSDNHPIQSSIEKHYNVEFK